MSDRFDRAVATIDAVNAEDPHRIVDGGVERPKEQVHAERMTAWVQRLDPRANEAQLLAARAHHLRRWSIPRDTYPTGRSGYLKWRTALKRQHAAEVADILGAVGYDDEVVERVAAIVSKHGLGRDPQVQVHEDALCLTFLELQSAELTDQLGHDKMVEVAVKTLAKMSPAAIELAGGLDLDARVRAVLADTSGAG